MKYHTMSLLSGIWAAISLFLIAQAINPSMVEHNLQRWIYAAFNTGIAVHFGIVAICWAILKVK
jgi:hypothetical protein